MTARVEVLHGAGTVIRFGDLTVWAGPTVSGELLMFLHQSARNVGESPQGGLRFVEHLVGVLTARDPEHGAPFAVVGPAAQDQWIALLHGPVLAWDGTRWLMTSPTPGWIQAIVEPQPAISLGPVGSAPPHLVLDSPYDLRAGMVPGGGAIVVPGAGQPLPSPDLLTPGMAAGVESGPTAATSTAQAAPVHAQVITAYPAVADPAGPTSSRPDDGLAAGPEPHNSGDRGDATSVATLATPSGTALVDLRAGAAETRPALPVGFRLPPATRPMVEGIRCPSGHFNHVDLPSCVWCGAAFPAGAVASPGPRPVLGILLADDGSSYRVAHDLLIGSDPTTDPSAAAGTIDTLVLRSDPGLLAPAHTELRLHDWTLRAVDRGSAAGTFVVTPGTEEWTRLTPYRPVDVQPGSHLSLGQRVLTYLSPWPA